MKNDWVTLPLSNIINLIGGGTPKRSNPKYWDGEIPWLSVKDFNDDFRYVHNADEHITKLGLSKSSTNVLNTGQLIISARGTVGELAQLTKEMAFNQSCYGIGAKPEHTTNDFLYYLLKYSIKNLQQITHGAVFDTITRDTFNHILVSIPKLDEQSHIVHILGALDDKIELNRQMNTTLEAMAQALFISWFVDFDPVIDNALAAGNPIPEPLQARAEIRKALGEQRKPLPGNIQFPNRFVLTDEMGWVPEGWEVVSLDDIFELIGGGTPKTSIDEYWNGNIPWFSVVDTPSPSDVFVNKTEKYISEEGLNNSSAKLLPIGTTIISARGTVGKCALVAQPMAINQSCYGIQGKAGISDYFVYYTVLLRVSELQQRGHGSVFNTITRDTFKSIKTSISAKQLTTVFHQQIEPYFSRVLENNLQSDCLSKLRDTLLPKLLSGELDVHEADAIIDKQLAEG